MNLPTHLSCSSVSAYQMCPKSWWYRYIDKPPVKTAVNLVFGSAFHGAIEQAIIEGVPASELWQKEWDKALDDPRNKEINYGDSSKDEMQQLGRRMLTTPSVAKQIAALQPLIVDNSVMIEKAFSANVPGVPVPIIGFIDIITADGIPGDFKTSSKKWYANKAEGEQQPVFYLAALNQEGYQLNPDLRFRHYVFTKTTKPIAQVCETQRTVAEMFSLFEQIIGVWDAIKKGTFPMNTTTWKCSAKWCEFFSMCQG